MTEPRTQARAAYRRKLQQRQTAFFSITGVILLALLVISILVWSGIMPAPFNREFSKSKDPLALVVPCLPEGSNKAVPPDTITVNVYNSSKIPGAAGRVSAALSKAGMKVGTTGNWSAKGVPESARVMTGPKGIAEAYTVAQYIPDSVVAYSADLPNATVEVVVGDKFDSVLSPDEANKANPGGTLTSEKKCKAPGDLEKNEK